MVIFSRNKNKEKLILVFYLGSSSVEGALFYTQKSGIPKIVFSISEPIDLEKTIEIDRFLTSTMKSLKIVVNLVHSAGFGAPDEIFCVLSSLWCISQTRIIKLEKNAPFIFTPKLADELIKKELALFEEENSVNYARSGSPVRLIEIKNIKTVLNGYETTNPLNQKGKEVEMTIFVSISGEQILGKIEETIKVDFHSKKVKFSSFALSSFAVIRDMYIQTENFLLVHVGGEVTDISMIKKNILNESISFPLGFNFMIRGVSFISNSSLSEAKSLISLLKDGHTTEALSKKIGPVVDKSKAEWLHKFQESLADISSDISVPATVYITVDKDIAELFVETIRGEQFHQYTLTESKFKVILLGIEVFHGLAQFEKDVVRDSFLVISSIYINRFLMNSSPSGQL